jgi:hypothetical protein
MKLSKKGLFPDECDTTSAPDLFIPHFITKFESVTAIYTEARNDYD